jgi:hypothetical protein
MAVAAWVIYDEAQRYMVDGTIDLPTTAMNVHLFTTASNAALDTLSALSELTNELASSNGYTLSGLALTDTWSTGASVSEFRYDATAVIWTASGGNLGGATLTRIAVLVAATGTSAKDTANKLFAYSILSTAGFAVADGNTLTLTPSVSNGIMELNKV